MWRLIWFLQGYVRSRLRGASPEWALERLADARVAFLRVRRIDDFTIELLLLKKDVPRAEQTAQKAMCELEITREFGFGKTFGGLWRRRLFALGLLLCAAGAFVIPKFVFFYDVVGNETVPDEKILRALHSLGVGFGTYGPDIQPQALKNKMLLLVPELQWFTVQQSGMCARVVVRERPEKLAVEERRAPMNVIAAKDGVLTSVSSLEGNCLCAPGQAVTRGQVLISAYTDLEFTTRVSAALGEIYAETLSRKEVLSPDTALYKQMTGKTARRVSLLAGEKRWNIFANGGNLTGKCDKITKTHMLTLPGGFELPIGLEITELSGYELVRKPMQEDRAREILIEQLERSVRQDMIAGEILDEALDMTRRDGVYTLQASVRCEEMIARQVNASILKEETIP